MKDDENYLRKILEIRVSRFSIDRKSLSINRTSQMVEFEFFNLFRSIGGHIRSIEIWEFRKFSKCFHMYKEKDHV